MQDILPAAIGAALSHAITVPIIKTDHYAKLEGRQLADISALGIRVGLIQLLRILNSLLGTVRSTKSSGSVVVCYTNGNVVICLLAAACRCGVS